MRDDCSISVDMTPIQALNRRKSPTQAAYRISVWAGSESRPGIRANWVIYGSGIPAVIGKAVRHFRKVTAPNARYSDWTVNVEPLREGEIIIEAEK